MKVHSQNLKIGQNEVLLTFFNFFEQENITQLKKDPKYDSAQI